MMVFIGFGTYNGRAVKCNPKRVFRGASCSMVNCVCRAVSDAVGQAVKDVVANEVQSEGPAHVPTHWGTWGG